MPADSREAQAARLALERLNSLAAAREEYKAWVLRQLHLGEELPTAAARGEVQGLLACWEFKLSACAWLSFGAVWTL